MEPTTGYARLGDQRIAYQIIGDGPIDLVIAPSWYSSFDVEWEEPMVQLALQRMASYSRVIRLDRRGSGASDSLLMTELPPFESFAEDIACVMDAVGAKEAAIYADGDAGPLGILFAATHPDRVRALILYGTTARFLADDDYEFGMQEDLVENLALEVTGEWGSGGGIEPLMPSRAGDPEFLRWMGKLQRAVTTPSAAESYMESVISVDVRALLPSLGVPALILHPTDGVLDLGHARYLADNIRDSRMVELPWGDVYPYFGNAEVVLSEMEEFLTGAPPTRPTQRALATVLFTDIVDSTGIATRMGDGRWRDLLDQHDRTVRRGILREGGQFIKTTGDGVLATFDGPGRAIRFALAAQKELQRLGLEVRTGIHTGEIELRDEEIGGLAVHLGARIMASAGPGEIMVSRTVKDLVIGSPIGFTDRGPHSLKGIEGEWELYSVDTA